MTEVLLRRVQARTEGGDALRPMKPNREANVVTTQLEFEMNALRKLSDSEAVLHEQKALERLWRKQSSELHSSRQDEVIERRGLGWLLVDLLSAALRNKPELVLQVAPGERPMSRDEWERRDPLRLVF